ncbi:MAG: HdaA/DnaA family protein [Alphaproteobacteria bacterium]
MSELEQLPLDLGLRPALGREDFMLAPCNEIAVAWIDRWPDWPGVAMALHGPSACGKTHLCHVWRALADALEISPATLATDDLPGLLGTAKAVALEDVDAKLSAGELDEERLLHLYNLVGERGGQVLLTARTPPARWPVDLPDLRSRLRAATAVVMAPPDDALIEAVLVKLFADRQLRVDADVVRFLMMRMERSFSAARNIVAAMDSAALADRRDITVALARRVLAGMVTDT